MLPACLAKCVCSRTSLSYQTCPRTKRFQSKLLLSETGFFSHLLVFRIKVETIGDTWLGVAGLPEKMANHAEVMALFSRDCLRAFKVMVNKLEVDLGPDTGGMKYWHC